MDDDKKITLTLENGEEVVCDILFTHYSKEFDKNYVVFCEPKSNEASAASYVPGENGNGMLEKIETDAEWEMLEDLLEDFSNQEEDGCGCGCDSCNGDCDCEHDHDECDCEGECHCHHDED